MLCDVCGKRDAIVFIHQVGAGEKTELHLCSQCAYEHGLKNLEGDMGKALTELLKSLPLERTPSTAEAPQLLKQKKKYPEHCPFCGISLQEIKKNGKAGCGTCWNIYKEVLLSAFTKEQGSIQHQGRYSRIITHAIHKKEELDRLRQLLQTAVTLEDYEQAARYRDQIKSLQQGE